MTLYLLIFVTVALTGIVLITIVNTIAMPRLAKRPGRPASPLVSVLIPARNEADLIGRTVRSLLAQDYPCFEVVVLDDNSTDETNAVARSAAAGDSRLQVLGGAPLAPGWLGKNWACHQLAQAARGEYLVFTDADVQWAPGALAATVGELERAGVDLLTVWPTQQTESWTERLVVPLMALVVVGYLPIPLAHYAPWPAFAAANGQCLVFRRRAYEAVGGHAAVRAEIVEDIVLARRVKAHRLRLWMADGAGLVGCRMYQGWSSVRDGFAKNILAGYGGRVLFLFMAMIFHWLLFLAPWFWLAVGRAGGVPAWPVWPLLLVGMGVGVRMLTAGVTRQRLTDALLMPLSVLLMTRIALQAVWWQWRYGGPLWKGRLVVSES